jgi:hypothetical protein
MVAEGGLEPPAVGAYETPALPTELFRETQGSTPSGMTEVVGAVGLEPTIMTESKSVALAARRRPGELVPPDGSDPSSAV